MENYGRRGAKTIIQKIENSRRNVYKKMKMSQGRKGYKHTENLW